MNAADEIMFDTMNAVEDALQSTLDDVADDLRKELSIPVDRSTKPPTRSKPGEYPRLDTGRLKASVQATMYRTGKDQLHGVIATNTPYDERLVAIRRDYPAYIQGKWNRLIEQRQQLLLK
jgi:hypothetical protein